jgi:hypothetical protein
MRFHPGSAILLGALLIALPHCSGQAADYCEKEKDCKGLNDKEVEACIAEIDGAEDVASAYDCSTEFDKLLTCAADKVTCKDGRLDDDPCEAEQKALSSCEGAASGKKKK